MKVKNNSGFTLIELIVVSAIIAILAGILVPVIIHEMDESKIARAKADLKTIQTAVAKFRNDNNAWPNRYEGSDPTTNTIKVLHSEGKEIASGLDWPIGNAAPPTYKPMVEFLGGGNNRNYPAATWKGPYMSATTADPWGNTYLISLINVDPAPPLDPDQRYPVWIISAGPDGMIQTSMNSNICMDGKTIDPATGIAAIGDDICLRLK